MLSVNLKSVFLCMKHQIPLMLQSGGGAIVNTSSGAGVMAIRNQSGYCASKFGVRGLAECLRVELKLRDIDVSLCCPGEIITPLVHDPAAAVAGKEEQP